MMQITKIIIIMVIKSRIRRVEYVAQTEEY
jgi:hypothetical protein